MTEEKKGEAQAAEEPKAEQTAADASEGNAPKKHKKNGWMVLGIVVAVIVIVGAGFWVWHEQPSFCNAICHSPMDSYVETYYSEDSGMMASVHENAGVNCLGCHEAKTTEQVTEVCAWVADDYPLYSDGTLASDTSGMASEETCAKSGCHNMDDVIANTWGYEGNDAKYNPHSSHQDGNIQCGDCHKSHSTSTVYCNQCHDLNMPDGWEAPNDQQ